VPRPTIAASSLRVQLISGARPIEILRVFDSPRLHSAARCHDDNGNACKSACSPIPIALPTEVASNRSRAGDAGKVRLDVDEEFQHRLPKV